MTYTAVSGGWDTEISFTQDATWNPVSLSGVSQGDVVHIHVVNAAAGADACGARPTGCADARVDDILSLTQCDIYCPVGSSDNIDLYGSATGELEFYHVGTIDGSDIELVQDFETAATNITPGTANDWKTIALSPTGSPVAAILEYTSTSTAEDFGTRHPDRTEDRRANGGKHQWAIANIDASDNIELYIDSITNQDVYLIGFILTGYTPYEETSVAARDDSIGSAGAPYVNLTALPAGASSGVWQVVNTTTTTSYNFFIREESTTHEYYVDTPGQWTQITVEGDGSRVVEGKIENTDLDFFLIGTWDAPAAGGSRRVFVT